MTGAESTISPGAALLIYLALTVFVTGAILGVAAFLRERRVSRTPDRIYESGAPPRARAGRPHNAPYFLIAAFFVIFDIEAAILFAWAVAAREAGVWGLVEAAIFIGVLLAALYYLLIDGALDFGPDVPRRRPSE